MPHTHPNHQGHHVVHHHTGHHEVKRGMETKTILWIMGVIFIAAILVAVFMFIPKGEEKVKILPASEQCAFFCDTNQRNSFCSFMIDTDDGLKTTCQELVTNPSYAGYNVQPCSSFSCELTAQEKDQTCVTGLGGMWEAPQQDGTCSQFGETIRVKLVPSDSPPAAGQICCA